MRPSWIYPAAFLAAFTQAVDAVNFNQCLANINNMTISGKTDNNGNLLPPSTNDSRAITYGLCVSQCGAGQEPFQWPVFSQQFSSWLLPWLALVSQLPFGANDKLDNLESMLLTVGSPVLASYSLALTILNGKWIAQLFANYRYPNVRSAVRILSSLQQSPIRVETDDIHLASLVVLPQNDEWWSETVVWLDYTHTWSISAATSIAWVLIAYIFTIVDYFSQTIPTTLNTTGQGTNGNGQGVGSIGILWLWLLVIVVGWLQLSPKCDSIRLNQALERANAIAYIATQNSTPCKASDVSDRRAISIKPSDGGARRDERCTPPIYNYARFLPWTQAVMAVSDVFHNASERNFHHEPIVPGAEWHDRESDKTSRLATASQVEEYCLPRTWDTGYSSKRRGGLDASVASRMLIASALALMLQWGTTGAAIIIVWFTPTIGLGCRSASLITYGVLSTIVWMMLLTSSILTHYSANTPVSQYKKHFAFLDWSRVASWLSIFLRRVGKLIATVNAVWVVATGVLQFASFYDRCYCNSSVFGLGKHAYNVIVPTQGDVTNMRAAWIGGFSLAAGASAIFVGFVNLFIDPQLPT